MITTLADNKLRARIRMATERSLLSRNRYTEQVVREVADDLAQVENLVKRSILRYDQLGSLPDNKLKAKTGLETLQANIDETLRELKKNHTLRFRSTIKESFRKGIHGGIEELVNAGWPDFATLKKDDRQSLSNSVFTLVDRDALDFLVNYSLVLAGDVQKELGTGIKRTLMTAIATGKGTADIVRDLGSVIKDLEAFRRAGGKVFQRAQYRMELIARTEVMRAHNQGRLKFHHEIGVQRLEWLASGDERVCPVCGPLHERVFDIEQLPPIPFHPQCRCSTVIAEPIELLSPTEIRQRSLAKKRKRRETKKVFEHGGRPDFEALSFGQLTDLAKDKGVSRSRTKSDLLREIKKAAPDTITDDLQGAGLEKVLQDLGIGRKRTKRDLVRELLKKQKEVRLAREQVKAIRANPKAQLGNLTLEELKRLAQKRGISTYISRDEVIELLNELNPNRDHGALSIAEIARLKKKHGIGRQKNKAMLIRSLEKLEGVKLAESLLS